MPKKAQSQYRHLFKYLLAGIPFGSTLFIPGIGFGCTIALLPLFWLLGRDEFLAASRKLRWFCIFLFSLGVFYSAGSWLFRFGFYNGLMLNGLNALLFSLMALPVWWSARSNLSNARQIFFRQLGFIFSWTAFEVLHLFWPLAYPLNSVGTALLDVPGSVQWYSATGSIGGTVWCLLVNLFAFQLLANLRTPSVRQLSLRYSLGALAILVSLPTLSVLGAFSPAHAVGFETINATLVHPNLDCYGARSTWSNDAITQYYADLIKPILQSNAPPDVLLLPENAIPDAGWRAELGKLTPTHPLLPLGEVLQLAPNTTLLTGACVFGQVPGSLRNSPLANYSSLIDHYYFAYNALVAVNGQSAELVRTKQQLVPFEETIPWANSLGSLLAKPAKQVGAFAYRFTKRKDRAPILALGNTGLLGLVCYESLFGNRMAEQLRKENAGLISVHLNEGWYDLPWAARLFEKHAQARAIESRRTLLRSSNRGYSSVIDPEGNILAKTGTKETSQLLHTNAVVSQHTTAYTSLTSRFIYGLLGVSYGLVLGWSILFRIGLSLVKNPKTDRTSAIPIQQPNHTRL